MIKMRKLLVVISLVMIFVQLADSQSTPTELAKQLIKDDSNVREVIQNTHLTLNKVVKQLTSKKVDLNGDGIPEYIVSGLICGQNCSHWIYQKSGTKFVQIPFEGSFIDLQVRPAKTKGYRDLLGRMFINAVEGALQTYKFDGFKYVASSCSIETFGYVDGKGNYNTYKTPKVKKGCD